MTHPAPMTFRLVLAAVSIVLALSLPAAARAAETPMPTHQAVAYGMDWVPYIDPADLPPVEQRKVVCLVDSGVNVTPDLPADRPEGPVILRTSLYGGSGEGGPAYEQQHGTRMALVAGAVPGNDYGTVGAWPGVRILSVRAMPYEATTFPVGMYEHGIRRCRTAALGGVPIAVTALALGTSEALSPEQREVLEDAVVRSHDQGINVVAAAGNRGLPSLDIPAAVPGVVGIAAGGSSSLCEHSNWVSGVIVGPGCHMDTADLADPAVPAHTNAGGTSAAAVFTATLVALLRTLRPDLSRLEAEQVIATSGVRRSIPGGEVIHLNGESAARSLGLGPVVDRARRRMPQPADAVPGAIPTQGPSHPSAEGSYGRPVRRPTIVKLPRPRAVVVYRKRVLTIRLRAVPKAAARVMISIRRAGRNGGSVTRDIVFVSSIRLTVKRRPDLVTLRYLPAPGATSDSATTTVRWRKPQRP